MRNFLRTAFFSTVLVSAAVMGWAQHAQHAQQGQHGQKGRHGQMDGDHATDQALFHYLLDHREEIRRTVTELPDGVETLTESDSAEVALNLREHVRAMYSRLEDGRPIHRRDPLFAEIFDNADKIEMTIEDTETGLRVRETSADPYVAKLIKRHAEVVSGFLANGRAEMRKNHELPARK